MSRTDDSFQVVLLETVEKVLVEVLGEKVTTALRFYMDLGTAMKNPDRFITLMADLVGQRQTDGLRRRVLEILHKEFGLIYQTSGARFSEEIGVVRSRMPR